MHEASHDPCRTSSGSGTWRYGHVGRNPINFGKCGQVSASDPADDAKQGTIMKRHPVLALLSIKQTSIGTDCVQKEKGFLHL